MYRYSVPIYNSHITPEQREAYLQTFRDADISRVFLIAKYDFETGEVFELPLLHENIAWLRENGIQPAIWAAETIGHGGLLHDTGCKEQAATPLRNFDGEDLPGTRCPLDKGFRRALLQIFHSLATAGAEYILIDDDFRISYHGKIHCCVCEAHLAEMSRRYGSPVTREQVRDAVMHGGPNPLRDVYLQAMGDTLRDLAREIRMTVDEVDPSVGLSLCTCHNHWDLDDADPVELTKILAGKHRAPLLRLHGAPYWAAHSPDKDLHYVMEHARMFAALSQGNGFELMNELDAYPRPRMRCPGTYMQLVDAVMHADSTTHGALKYMYDYISTLSYETGYLEQHKRDLRAMEKMEEMFSQGTQTGVNVSVFPHLIAQNDSDLTPPHQQMPRPLAGIMAARCSLPTTYTDQGLCRMIFGQDARAVDPSTLGNALVLDAVSALLLAERGVDVGLAAGQDLRAALCDLAPNRVLRADGAEQAALIKAAGKFLTAPLSAGAEVQLLISANGAQYPLCYRYENAAGQRFLVWSFHAATLMRDSDLFEGYLIQQAMTSGIEWVEKKPLPVKCEGHPQLYVMCRETEKTLTVGLFNCFADPIFTPTLTLNAPYRKVTQFVGTSVHLDENIARLDALYPFSFCAFTVEK